MRMLMPVLYFLALPAASLDQELPKVTEEAKNAAAALLEVCKKAGALKVVTDPHTKAERIVVADEAKLKEVLQQQRQRFTPALRDALLRCHKHPGAVTVLLRLGQATGDDVAVAFGKFFAGRILDDQFKDPEARQAFEQAASLFAQLKMTEWQAVALNNLATVCHRQRDLPHARQVLARVIELFKQIHGERHPTVATGLNNLATVCHVQGELALARQLHQQALDMRRECLGEQHSDVAQSLSGLAEVCFAQGDLPQARQLHEQALKLCRKLHGERHVTIARSLSFLGTVCRAQGELALARQFHQQALDMRRELLGERDPAVSQSLNALGLVCRDEGNLPQARKLFQQAIDLDKQIYGEQRADVTAALNNLGLVCREEGDLPQARKLLVQALDLKKRIYGERQITVADSLNNLANVVCDQGDLPRARQLLEQALDLRRQLLGERHPTVAVALNNLAVVCENQGDLRHARKLHEQALDLLKRTHGDRHPAVATSLNNLAHVVRDQGDLSQARRLHEQALAIRRRLLGIHHRDVAISLHNLALVSLAQRDLHQARQLAQEALALYKQSHGERHPVVVQCLTTLAMVCFAQGDLPGTVRYCSEAALTCRLPHITRDALDTLTPQDLTCDPSTVQCLHAYGLALQRSNDRRDLGQARRAASALALAAGLLDRLRAEVLESDESKLIQGAERAALVPARVRLAATLFDLTGKAEDLHTAFNAVEQGRARVFLEALARARSHQVGGVPETRLQQERDLLSFLRGLEGRLQKENNKTLDQRNADLVGKLYHELNCKRDELDRLAAQLRQDYPQYAALQYPKPCTVNQARDRLAEHEVAVLFTVDKKESFAVVVQKQPAPNDKRLGMAVVRLPGSDVLAPLVATLVDPEVLKSDSRCRDLGAQLYDLLLKPLAPHIQGKDLVLAPDGVLWTLPFELLVEGRTDDRDGQYLVETRQLRYTPSMTVLHVNRQWEEKRPAPPELLWALADPVFSKDNPRATGDLHEETRHLLERYALRGHRDGSAWARLPATRAEVRAIAGLHGAGKDDVALDTSASEQVLKTASSQGILARKRYLHLATHGILGVGLGRQPSLVLSLVGNDGKEQLGGVNDGFLTMEEVTHLKLNADLVVLSACETGKGDLVAGEGVMALTRSFLYAGSRGVVCSLWNVDDERTAALMQALYSQLKKGKPAAEALALARRQLIAQEQAPFYWAPFILIGK